MPELTIAVAHGKMGEEALSDVMQSMADGEIQVLVCTTIIETGLDIPNVNTLIIENADRLGLSQLHQLRGRVGRSSRHAFAISPTSRDRGAHRGGGEAAHGHPGLCRVWLRLQDRYAGPGDPGRRQPSGAGAIPAI